MRATPTAGPTRIGQVLRLAARGWVEDDAASLGAALAFFGAFSLAPLLVIVTGLVGLAFSSDQAERVIVEQISRYVGSDEARWLATVGAAARAASANGAMHVWGIVALAVGSLSGFVELKGALDRVWGTPRAAPRGLWAFIRTRLVSLALVISLSILALLALLVDSAASTLAQWRGLPPGFGLALRYVAPLSAVALVIALIALIFRFLPAARVDWRDAWRGALLTAILIEIGRAAIGAYLRFSSIPNLYDAAGALVLLLFWLYYSALVFLFGAEVTWALGLRRSGRTKGPSAAMR